MMIRKIFFTAAILVVGFFFAVHARAQAGISFWSAFPGNSWVYDGSTAFGDSWTYRIETSGPDTTTIPGQVTYQYTGYEDGTPWEKEWLSFNSAELRLWRLDLFEDEPPAPYWVVLIINGGSVMAKNPVIVGDSWTETLTGTLNGSPVSISVTTSVENHDFATVPLGTYQAYKIHRVSNISGIGAIVQDLWVVPYIGIIRRETGFPGDPIETEVLNSMNIKKGVVDFDGDGSTDVSAYHLPTNQSLLESLGNLGQYGWGGSESVPLVWDYDGDGVTEVSIYHIPTNQWFVQGYPGDNLGQLGWGGDESIPLPGDYDGDGLTDRAFYHWPTNRWFVEQPDQSVDAYDFGWGGADCIPIAADYDGDGFTDMMLYHMPTNQWFVYGTGNLGQFGWNGSECLPVPGDWDGDGKVEIGIYHVPSNQWFWRDQDGTDHFLGQYGWGGTESFPIPGDYNGDGLMERAFYRPSENWWFIEGEADFVWGWGGTEFMPITSQMAVYNWFRFMLGMFQ